MCLLTLPREPSAKNNNENQTRSCNWLRLKIRVKILFYGRSKRTINTNNFIWFNLIPVYRKFWWHRDVWRDTGGYRQESRLWETLQHTWCILDQFLIRGKKRQIKIYEANSWETKVYRKVRKWLPWKSRQGYSWGVARGWRGHVEGNFRFYVLSALTGAITLTH